MTRIRPENRVPTIHREICSGDEGCRGRQQETDHLGNFLCIGNSAQWVQNRADTVGMGSVA